MNRIMEIPGFKGVIVEKMEQLEERVTLHVSMPKKEHTCPDCKKKTIRVHDYRIQKIKHLKWFERLSTIFISVDDTYVNVGRDFRRRVL